MHGVGREPGAREAAVAYGDTSTGVANDVRAIASVARAHGAMVLVDGVSSIGGMPFSFDDWGIDVAITASQVWIGCAPASDRPSTAPSTLSSLATSAVSLLPLAMTIRVSRSSATARSISRSNGCLPVSRARSASHHAASAAETTKSTPTATCASRTTAVTAPSAMTLSGEVALLAVSSAIRPQCRWKARLRA